MDPEDSTSMELAPEDFEHQYQLVWREEEGYTPPSSAPQLNDLQIELQRLLVRLDHDCQVLRFQQQQLWGVERADVPREVAAQYADLPADMPIVRIYVPEAVYFYWSPGDEHEGGYGYWELRHPAWRLYRPEDAQGVLGALRIFPDGVEVLPEQRPDEPGHHHVRDLATQFLPNLAEAGRVESRFRYLAMQYFFEWDALTHRIDPNLVASWANFRFNRYRERSPLSMDERRFRIRNLHARLAWHRWTDVRERAEQQQEQQQEDPAHWALPPPETYKQNLRNWQMRGIAHEIQRERRRLASDQRIESERDRGSASSIDAQRQEEFRNHTQEQRARKRGPDAS